MKKKQQKRVKFIKKNDLMNQWPHYLSYSLTFSVHIHWWALYEDEDHEEAKCRLLVNKQKTEKIGAPHTFYSGLMLALFSNHLKFHLIQIITSSIHMQYCVHTLYTFWYLFITRAITFLLGAQLC